MPTFARLTGAILFGLLAVINVFQLMVDWFMDFAVVELGVLMAVGSVVGGFITEFVGKRWS